MKRVLLDCDGVLSDFSKGICDVVNLITGRDTKPSDITQWDFNKALELDEHDAAAVKRKLDRVSFWESLKPCEGAIEGVNLLAARAEIYVVTSPWYSCEGWEAARREWLYRHFEIERERVIPTAAKHVISGDFFVDDKTSNLREWRAANPTGTGIRWIAPYNRLGPWEGLETNSWDTLVSIVRSSR